MAGISSVALLVDGVQEHLVPLFAALRRVRRTLRHSTLGTSTVRDDISERKVVRLVLAEDEDVTEIEGGKKQLFGGKRPIDRPGSNSHKTEL